MRSATKGFGPYSPIRQAGQYFFISGQVGVSEAGDAEADVTAQAHQAMKNMQAVLKACGLTMDNLVKTTIFLKHMSDYQTVNEAYGSYFSGTRPARSCVAVAALPDVADEELLVEIEAVAYEEKGE